MHSHIWGKFPFGYEKMWECLAINEEAFSHKYDMASEVSLYFLTVCHACTVHPRIIYQSGGGEILSMYLCIYELVGDMGRALKYSLGGRGGGGGIGSNNIPSTLPPTTSFH